MAVYNVFSLKIYLGNEAMLGSEDIARALDKVARKVREGRTRGPVLDENGNTVGEYKMTTEKVGGG